MNIPADRERKEYESLRTGIQAAVTHSDVQQVARSVKRFVKTEPNPVYADSLITLLMRRGLGVVAAQDFEGAPTFSAMAVRRVSNDVLSAFATWQAIMEDNASSSQE